MTSNNIEITYQGIVGGLEGYFNALLTPENRAIAEITSNSTNLLLKGSAQTLGQLQSVKKVVDSGNPQREVMVQFTAFSIGVIAGKLAKLGIGRAGATDLQKNVLGGITAGIVTTTFAEDLAQKMFPEDWTFSKASVGIFEFYIEGIRVAFNGVGSVIDTVIGESDLSAAEKQALSNELKGAIEIEIQKITAPDIITSLENNVFAFAKDAYLVDPDIVYQYSYTDEQGNLTQQDITLYDLIMQNVSEEATNMAEMIWEGTNGQRYAVITPDSFITLNGTQYKIAGIPIDAKEDERTVSSDGDTPTILLGSKEDDMLYSNGPGDIVLAGPGDDTLVGAVITEEQHDEAPAYEAFSFLFGGEGSDQYYTGNYSYVIDDGNGDSITFEPPKGEEDFHSIPVDGSSRVFPDATPFPFVGDTGIVTFTSNTNTPIGMVSFDESDTYLLDADATVFTHDGTEGYVTPNGRQTIGFTNGPNPVTHELLAGLTYFQYEGATVVERPYFMDVDLEGRIATLGEGDRFFISKPNGDTLSPGDFGIHYQYTEFYYHPSWDPTIESDTPILEYDIGIREYTGTEQPEYLSRDTTKFDGQLQGINDDLALASLSKVGPNQDVPTFEITDTFPNFFDGPFEITPPSTDFSTETLDITVKGDTYIDYARFNVTVDGTMVARELAATQANWQEGTTFSLQVPGLQPDSRVEIEFTNDIDDGTWDTNRNLYVTAVSIAGQEQDLNTGTFTANGLTSQNSGNLWVNGTFVLNPDGPANPGGNTGNSQDAPATIVILANGETSPQGPVFDLLIDGQVVAANNQVTALNWQAPQLFTFNVPTLYSDSRIEVAYKNDAGAAERNLYIKDVQVNGATLDRNTATFEANGMSSANTGNLWVDGSFVIEPGEAATPRPTSTGNGASSIVVEASGTSWNGDPVFQLFVDGQQVGNDTAVSATFGQNVDRFTFSTLALTSASVIEVKYINDANNGNPNEDRNLNINAIEVNGTTLDAGQSIYTSWGQSTVGQQFMFGIGDITYNMADNPGVSLGGASDPLTNPFDANNTLRGQGVGDILINPYNRADAHGGAILTGGNGADTFVYGLGDGAVVITDFQDDVDNLQLIAGQSDYVTRDVLNGTFYDFGNNQGVLVAGIAAQALQNDLV
ncbi:MAG: carbohydrate-binding domain-containing protein [Cyanobacteria bacterium P01_D01_bin.156]